MRYSLKWIALPVPVHVICEVAFAWTSFVVDGYFILYWLKLYIKMSVILDQPVLYILSWHGSLIYWEAS